MHFEKAKYTESSWTHSAQQSHSTAATLVLFTCHPLPPSPSPAHDVLQPLHICLPQLAPATAGPSHQGHTGQAVPEGLDHMSHTLTRATTFLQVSCE
jgi:hypothetical protein